ncbi:MAG: bifunctional methylenetetrahydrofolate dehydrogenase/methenyltetrahydrofolate cyclohydrolase FolD [Waddliaceae bacterium]|jgi:methylenetetrahydrofolate dehydrogenase (NADP+) / methenyltetrahydrofolate cyclohydrolase|nr:bifunctional methylenetetrahydrofolate dehydrogenase/methenyltetrahydrofolate cyclohydrolase FolD [Waddliaceae bacterium]MBT7264547.1 bifunctional methylenetetrahydrofolate dehydrogenase/methenyltetrahydrofolate cyclohydrolase FolD [Waddliaceae bacterium]
MTTILDGKATAIQIEEELKSIIAASSGRQPCLALILVGENPASKVYVSTKKRKCEALGILSIIHDFPDTIDEKTILTTIATLNADDTVDGILVQLPLPNHIDALKVCSAVSPEKDVDGFHPTNVGKLLLGNDDGFISCTPYGISTLMERYGIETAGKHAVIVGRSNIVGKPMAAILMQKSPHGNATVTVANSRTPNLKEVCRSADILISAIGSPHFITADMVKNDAIVIDVGINKVTDTTKPRGYKLTGDVDFENVAKKTAFITPVPGGIGPMTVAMLLTNTIKAYKQHMSKAPR